MKDQVPIQFPLRRNCGGLIDRKIAEEGYKEYVERYGSRQSFERLHERGGFGVIELFNLLYDRIKRLEGEYDE